jgi:hypothetical protein
MKAILSGVPLIKHFDFEILAEQMNPFKVDLV